MAFYSGSNGQLLIDGKQAGRVSSWSFSSDLAVLDTTSLEDTDRTVTPGVRSTTGSCTLFYYAEDPTNRATNSASGLINKLLKQHTAGTSPGRADEAEAVVLRLRVDDGTTAGKFIEGQVYLTSVQMTMAVGEVLSAQCGFEFNGAPTGVDL
jgi:hypothetical protein